MTFRVFGHPGSNPDGSGLLYGVELLDGDGNVITETRGIFDRETAGEIGKALLRGHTADPYAHKEAGG